MSVSLEVDLKAGCGLGVGVQVRTVEGSMEMQVPAGTQPGDQLVLTKMGVPRLNKPTLRGDHIFTVAVAIPNKLRSGPEPRKPWNLKP